MNFVKPTFLRCEYLVNPLGINVARPRLYWRLDSNERNQKQTAYRVLVATSEQKLREEKADLWDSGKIASDLSIHVTYQGKDLRSKANCYWKVKVWDRDDKPSEWSPVAFWTMGLLTPSDWNAKWIGGSPRKVSKLKRLYPKKSKYFPCPLLRKTFSVEGMVKRALLYASALGEYLLAINGVRVGDRYLSPEWTDYKKRVQYQTYEVGDLLRPGENAIGAVLADGWMAGNLGPIGMVHDYYGVDPLLIFHLTVELTDGSVKKIVSDSSWKIYEDGPIQKADHFKGETYDARKECSGWDLPEFNDSKWMFVNIYDKIEANLVAQMNDPIRVVREIKPIRLMEPKPGVFIFDLGQNIAGWCKVRLNNALCEPNAIVKLRHGEMLEEDGTLFTENLRTAEATDVYILANSEEREYHPFFTYHGFHFVELTGLKQGAKPTHDTVTGCVISSDCRQTGAFESSNPKLNRLWNNIVWTQRDNLISVPTDCPQRDERMGWMGDVQVFSQTSIFNMDMAAFYAKWIRDMRDAQLKNGKFPDIVPFPNAGVNKIVPFAGAPGWTDCGITLPWDMYLNYADYDLLRIHYDSAKRLVDFVRAKNPGLIWKKGRGRDYNDWLNGDKIQSPDYPKSGATVPKEVFATAFFAHSTELISKMAKIFGYVPAYELYSNLADQIKHAFVENFVDSDGRIMGDTQAGYALALHFNLLPESLRPKAANHMIEAVEKYDGRLSTGFCTTLRMMRELVRWGYSEVAYNLLLSDRFPSWFYMIDQGATTMWERWDSYVKGRGFQSRRMNSFNHYAYGSIGEFLYGVVLGINIDENAPGYKHIVLEPVPDKRLRWVKGSFDSIYGQIFVSWEFSADRLTMSVVIPANASATIHIPASRSTTVKEGGFPLTSHKDVKIIEILDKSIIINVKSGSYSFEILNP